MAVDTNVRRSDWTKLCAPALGIVLVYVSAIARPAYQRQQKDFGTLQAVQTAIHDLQQRKLTLAQTLSSASVDVRTGADVVPQVDAKMVSRSEDSPAQLCSKLLDSAEKAGLRCVQVSSGNERDVERPSGNSTAAAELKLELIGSFEQLSKWLIGLSSDLDAVSVRTLRMINRGNGECLWQIEIELRGGLV